MPPEIVLLQHQDLSKVYQRRSEKVWHPLCEIEQEHLIDGICSTLIDHCLQPLLWHFNYFLECLIQFDLGQFVRTLDHLHWLLRPLLVEERLGTYLILVFLRHRLDVGVALHFRSEIPIELAWPRFGERPVRGRKEKMESRYGCTLLFK